MSTNTNKRTKWQKIAYWFFTLWLSLGMVSTAIVQLIQQKDEMQMISHLGYPAYFTLIIGVWKILGVVAVLVPRFALVKEWAYAGFFFIMSGAILSHIAVGDGFAAIFPSILLLTLTLISWYLRPVDRKLAAANVQ